jgi:hypothetical protein
MTGYTSCTGTMMIQYRTLVTGGMTGREKQKFAEKW